MRAVFGLLLVMLGLAMAVVWMPERDGQRQLAVVTDIAIQGLPRADPAAGNGRTFSPHTPLLATVEPPGSRPAATIAVARAVVPAVEAPVQTATGSSVVTGSIAHAGQPATAQAPRGSTNASADMSRDELVRNLQRELKRVGCYAGDVDGDWGTGSKRAMLAFTDRVNASLPVEQPDFILLTLLKGQSPGVCGRSCPTGQTIADSGRCMPAAVIAQQQAKRRGTRDDAATQTAPVTTAGWSTQVARPTAGTQREIDAGTVAAGVAAGAVVAAAVAPIPGRMSVGGPSAGHAASGSSDNGSAREAVRSAQNDQSEARPARRNARRTAAARRPAVRYERPYVVYRSAPSYYAYAPRASSRSWTANFFRTN